MTEPRELFRLSQVSQLARAISELKEFVQTDSAISQARACIIDAFATILAGVASPSVRVLLSIPGLCSNSGEALVFGTGRRTCALDACLVNAAAFHASETTEPSGVFGGTSSGSLVSALFALGEERKASGKQVLLAFLVGREVARLMNFDRARHHSIAGELTDGVIATLSVAGACAHLLHLDEQRTTTALVLAATFSSGMHALSTPLHLGYCARHGLLATLLAEYGFVAGCEAAEVARTVLCAFEGGALFAEQTTPEHDIDRQNAAWDKFCECAAVCLPRPQIAPLFERLETLESADDLGLVTRLAELSELHERRITSPAHVAPAADQSPWQLDTSWVP